jgi:hypothetical protein
VFYELLKRIRHDYPGAWYCAQQWERSAFPTPAAYVAPVIEKEKLPDVNKQAVETIKEVSREAWGLPGDGKIGDVPA